MTTAPSFTVQGIPLCTPHCATPSRGIPPGMTETPPFSATDFAVPLRRGRANIIAVESGGDLAGYAVYLYKTEKDSRYTFAGVADMQVAEGSPERVGALLV